MAETTEKRKKLAVIDGKSVFYRGYYAMPNLSTKDGTPTGGVYGFATLALEVIKRLKPDYVAVAWDKPKTNIRRRLAIYPEYKAGRKPPPADFYEQIPVLHELLQAFGWPLYELDDYEADDIMGTLGVQASKQGIETLLVTSDMDMLQLVDPNVKVFALKKGLTSIELYSPESFTAKYGIRVDQFLDLKSLKGDSSDNIPGVPGIGEKGAVQLLQEHETLDGIYENLDLLKESLRKKLEAGKKSAYMSKELAAIWCDAPIKLDLKEVDGSKIQPDKLHALLQKLEFKTLARQLPDIMQVAVDNHLLEKGDISVHKLKPGKNTLIDAPAKLQDFSLPKGKYVYVHSRSAGKHGRQPQRLLISGDGRETFTLELDKLDSKAVVALFADAPLLVGYDLKSTLKVLLELGCKELPVIGHDVLISSFILNALRREQSLTELAQADLDYEGSPFEDIDVDELTTRAPEIIAVIRALYDQQAKEMASIPKLPELAHDVEWPVIPVLARMEWRGIELDTYYLENFAKEVDKLIQAYEKQIYDHAGEPFNIGSPTQLATVLFAEDKLNLPKQGRTSHKRRWLSWLSLTVHP